jgi:histidinol dehydrogenase
MRRVSIVESSRTSLDRVRDTLKVLAESENLPNHFKAIQARFER